MNFLELCRKDAGWPELHRHVPKKGGNERWSITQEEVAAFVGAVQNRGNDLVDELRAKDERIAKLADEKAAMAKRNAQLETQLSLVEIARRVKQAGESMGLEDGQTKRLASAVEK